MPHGDPRGAEAARRRRDAPRAVGKAGGGLQDPCRRAPGPHCQLEPGAQVGHVGRVPQARGAGSHDVRSDDRGLVDLHRHAGNPAGHVRDVRRGRAARPGLSGWLSRRPPRGHGRARRNGRRAASRRHDVRWHRALRRGGFRADRQAPRDPLPGRAHRRSRPRDRSGARGDARVRGRFDRCARERRGPSREAPRARDRARSPHRPDLRARRAQRLRAARPAPRGGAEAPGRGPRGLQGAERRVPGRARPRDARAQGARLRDVRLRQQSPRAGRLGGRLERVRDRRVRAALHPSVVLRRQGARSVGPLSRGIPGTSR